MCADTYTICGYTYTCWSGLSAGAIVGIVVAVVVAIGVLVYAGSKLADNRKKFARFPSLPIGIYI